MQHKSGLYEFCLGSSCFIMISFATISIYLIMLSYYFLFIDSENYEFKRPCLNFGQATYISLSGLFSWFLHFSNFFSSWRTISRGGFSIDLTNERISENQNVMHTWSLQYLRLDDAWRCSLLCCEWHSIVGSGGYQCSTEPTTTISYPEDWGNVFFWNVGDHLSLYSDITQMTTDYFSLCNIWSSAVLSQFIVQEANFRSAGQKVKWQK